MTGNRQEVIYSRIWEEEPEPDNPYAAARCVCHGYDVFGDMLGKTSWTEYLFLLFAGERPTSQQSKILEGMAVALANPGPRDHSVRAAMNGGVGGSQNAACLMAALAVGAGGLGGGHEVAVAMENWAACGDAMSKWKERLLDPPLDERADTWMPMEHAPGFDPHGASCTTPVQQTLTYLAQCSPGYALLWLDEHRRALEQIAGSPLAMTGVAAAAFTDLGLEPGQGEMLFLLLRLPGAAVHALEQREYGWRKYPFFSDSLHLENDPGPVKASKKSA